MSLSFLRLSARICLRTVVKTREFRFTEKPQLQKTVWSMAARSSSHMSGLPPVGIEGRTARSDQHFERVLLALQTYKRLNGDLLIPAAFYVPGDDLEWPKETWNLQLGEILKNLYLGSSYREKSKELSAIGIEIEFKAPKPSQYAIIEIALLHFKKTHGHMDVPLEMNILPGDTSFPEITWGFKLGKIVLNIRRGRSCIVNRERLIEIGFNFDIK
jgi:hypothetical protein